MDTFENALSVMKKLGEDSNISKLTLDYLSGPEQMITVNLPIRMDNGEVRIFTGYRSRYNTVLGPAKGGVRFDLGVNSGEVNSLALWMTLKTSLVGLPYGGGKGGIKVDTRTLSLLELERLSRSYIRAIADEIGTYIDVMAPDVATDDRTMYWMVDEYEKIKRVKSPAAITGKPVESGGSLFRTEATGFGVATIIRLMTDKLNKNPKDTTVAIQGFGNVGSYLTKYLNDMNYKICAISDVKGMIVNKKGINADKLINKIADLKQSGRRNFSICDDDLVSLVDGEVLPTNEILEQDVDILVPAALEDVIREDNMDKIKARYIVEAANGPVSGNIDNELYQRGFTIVPDVLANAGGVSVSYFEWVQNIQCYQWSKSKVKSSLVEILTEAFNSIWDLSQERQISLRSAAYALALQRIEKVLHIRYGRIV